jgi:hypothetical protein
VASPVDGDGVKSSARCIGVANVLMAARDRVLPPLTPGFPGGL